TVKKAIFQLASGTVRPPQTTASTFLQVGGTTSPARLMSRIQTLAPVGSRAAPNVGHVSCWALLRVLLAFTVQMPLPKTIVTQSWIDVGRASMRHEAAGRNFLLGRVPSRSFFDHGADYAIVAGVPVGRNLPVLAVPGLDASGARALVVLAGHLDRVQLVFEAELLEPLRGEIEVLEAPTHLLTGHGLLAEPLLGGADRLDPEHGVDQSAHVEDFARLLPSRGALAFVVDVLFQIVMQLEPTRGVLQRGRVVSLGAVFGRPNVRLGTRPPHAV